MLQQPNWVTAEARIFPEIRDRQQARTSERRVSSERWREMASLIRGVVRRRVSGPGALEAEAPRVVAARDFTSGAAFRALAGLAVGILAVAATAESAPPDQAKARKKLDDDYVKFTAEEFISQVHHGDKKMVQLFLDAGFAVDSPDARGRTALYEAAEADDGKMLALLLKVGASPNVADKDGITPLCAVADRGAFAVLANFNTLLQAKADPGAICGLDRETPLHLAAKGDRADMVKALIAAGAPLNARDRSQQTPLHRAAGQMGGTALQVLLAAHADVNLKDSSGDSPLHAANNSRHAANVKALIAAGAIVDARNSRGETPLFEAARNGKVELISILLDAGADPALGDDQKTTPLQIAGQVGALDAVERLKGAKRVAAPPVAPKAAAIAESDGDPKQALAKMGLKLDEKTFFGRVEAGDARALGLFLKAGFPPGTRNEYGRTGLYLTIERGQVEAVRALLEGGASPDDGGRDTRRVAGHSVEYGTTPLMAAIDGDSLEIVLALLDAKAALEKTDTMGQTALNRAAAFGRVEILRALIKAGANVNAVTTAGMPVLMGPVSQGHVEIVKALLSAGAKPGKYKADLLAAAGKHAEVKKLILAAR